MDSTPYFDPETTSVCFHAQVRGLPVRAFVTREWLVNRYGPDVPENAGIVATYTAHAAVIDTEIARRFDRGRPEPIWLASAARLVE